jgi:hypothetical protein
MSTAGEAVQKAIRWGRFSLHTEAQMSVLGARKVRVKQNDKAMEKSLKIADGRDCYSLFNPCESCRALSWVAQRRNRDVIGRFLFSLEDSSLEALEQGNWRSW